MALKMFNLKENPRNKKFREAFAQMPGLLDFYLNTIKGTQYMVYELQFGEKFYGCSSSIVEKSNGIIMIFRDITEKKLTDEHLKRVDRLISLGRVAAGIAHEIRNPLTGINLLLEDLHDKLEKEDRDLIKKSLDEITRLENIVSELLDYASPVKEGFERFMLSEIIETSVFFIQKQAKNKNIRITNRVEDNVKLYCSMDKLKQAIINILLNSIEAVEKNGEIVIESEILGNNVILSIKDTGCGIDEKNIKYIFDPFFTTKTKGTGLGLAITHSIIHEHQGKISVDSKKGEGTKFTIVLPIE
jgi:signal transduction histidine kinase